MFQNRFYIAALLGAVFIITILLTVSGGAAAAALASDGTDPAGALAAAQIPQLSTNLRNELNSALSPEFSFDFEAVGNPFADKSGVSLAVSQPSGAVGGQPGRMTAYPKQGMMPPAGFPANLPSHAAMGQPKSGIPNAMQPPPSSALPAVQTNTSELVKERQRDIKLGRPAPPLASLYAIDDLYPYGVVGSGSTNKVKLYNPETKMRFAVAKGTRFRDGTVESIGDEGVKFRRTGGETVFKRWMKKAQKSIGNQPDAPVLRVEQP